MTLTDQYIAATLAATPSSQRADVEADLRAAIADAIEARLDAGDFANDPATASAVETAVLNDMGDPEALAAQYADRPLYLIGPHLFLQWKRLVILLLWIVVPIVAIVVALTSALGGEGVAGTIGATLAAVWGTGLLILFCVTVVFAMIDRYSPSDLDSLTTPWSVDRLAAVPEARVTLSDTIGAAASLVITAALLVWQQVSPWASGDGGAPVINPDLWTFTLPAVLVVVAIELVVTVARHARGHWSMRDWWIGLALNVATLALLAPAMLTGNFLNQELADIAGWPDANAPLTLEQLDMGLWLVVLAVAVTDVVSTWRKARRGLDQAGPGSAKAATPPRG